MKQRRTIFRELDNTWLYVLAAITLIIIITLIVLCCLFGCDCSGMYAKDEKADADKDKKKDDQDKKKKDEQQAEDEKKKKE